MNPWARILRSVLPFLLTIVLVYAGTTQAANTVPNNQTGFLIIAADRGFLGNEEIRDAFEPFSANHPAALVFVTDERTQQTLKSGLDSLRHQGVERIVVLPLFISAAEPRYRLVHQLLTQEKGNTPPVFARLYGESYFAVEALADRFHMMEQTTDQHLLVVGYGATDDASKQAMHKDWARIVKQASQGFDFRSTHTLVLPERGTDEDGEHYATRVTQQLTDALTSLKPVVKGGQNQVIAFALGPKHDSMMSLEARLEWLLPENPTLNNFQIKSRQLTMWMEREASRTLPIAAEDTGVIIFAHGSDFHWNENLRIAVQPLMDRYKVEFAFSMADPITIERALRKLEQRDAKAVVIVSAYATSTSFRTDIERLVGLDIEDQSVQHSANGHGGHDGHGHHGKSSKPSPRILTSLPVVWTGGYEDNPLFANALLDRALALSKDPTKETVILVAHGARDDQRNETWLQKLENIANHMRSNGGEKFKAIQVATWREDWPEKRAPWIEKVRTMVTEANKQGGKAIVIPARTTATGPEKKFLAGLEFELGEGFAPHPLFTQWVDEQIQQGMKQHATAINHSK
ncbi:MAG: cobalamin biosynthesis protein CbiX [Nitrosomonas sp.]|nr:cobalamin biosynthesis protein CbiX [Nitrosomonas sp.]